MRYRSESVKQAIIDFVNEYYSIYGVSPTIYDIAERLSIDKSTASRYLQEMSATGLIELDAKRRGINTEYTKRYKNLKNVAVVGNIACGTPILAEQNVESDFMISESLLGEGEFFALRAKGDSMIDAGINDGDYVIVRSQNTAEEGQIVVALIDDVATLKRFYIDKTDRRIRLHPENSEMEDMYFDSIYIQGVVKKIIKDCD